MFFSSSFRTHFCGSTGTNRFFQANFEAKCMFHFIFYVNILCLLCSIISGGSEFRVTFSYYIYKPCVETPETSLEGGISAAH